LIYCLGEQPLVAHEHGLVLVGDNRKEGVEETSQASRHLGRTCPELGNLSESKIDELIPGSNRGDESHHSGLVGKETSRPRTGGHEAQEVLETVKYLDGRGRRVHGRREGLSGDVDQRSYPVERVLVDGALRADIYGAKELLVGNPGYRQRGQDPGLPHLQRYFRDTPAIVLSPQSHRSSPRLLEETIGRASRNTYQHRLEAMRTRSA
jgi:hypothetical protein